MIKRILAIYITVAPLIAMAQSTAQQADEAYSASNYQEAVALYKKALADEGSSSDLYYNLGNAYYRCDSLGQAIIAYERALKLDPTNSDALTNLRFVNTKTLDTPADNNSSYVKMMLEQAVRSMTANGWAWTTLGVFVVILSMVAGYLFMESIPVRKFCFFGGIVLVLVFGVMVYVTLTASRWQNRDTDAIITAESSQLSTSPTTPVNASQQAFLLHEGTKVHIIDSVATPLDPVTPKWYEVKVDNEHRAWIDSRDVEKI